ncbi:MAG: DUF1573 domain-containing protein [Isosphaeraceae bacterium]
MHRRVSIELSSGRAYRSPWVFSRLCSFCTDCSPQIIPPPHSNLTGPGSDFFPVEISPDPIDFGVIRWARVPRAPLSLRNVRSDPLTIDRIETSCECVSVAPVPVEIGPRQTRVVSVSFDPSSEPGFEGGLAVRLTAYLSGGEVAFRTTVNARLCHKQ